MTLPILRINSIKLVIKSIVYIILTDALRSSERNTSYAISIRNIQSVLK